MIMVNNSARTATLHRYLLCGALLLGIVWAQMAILRHAIEHDIHEHTELCDIFLAFEHFAAAVDVADMLLSELPTRQILVKEIYVFLCSHCSLYAIRGPPPLLV